MKRLFLSMLLLAACTVPTPVTTPAQTALPTPTSSLSVAVTPTPTVTPTILSTPPSAQAQAYSGPYDPHGPDRDCDDFATQAEAQAFFEAAGGPEHDPHRLDRDRDGIACEKN